MIKLIEVIPEGASRVPRVETVADDLAVKMLGKSKNWAIHPDEKKVFIDGAIYQEGKEPDQVRPRGVLLISNHGKERFETDIQLAEKMLKKSLRKKTWVLHKDEKNFTFDEQSLVLVAKAKKAPPASDNKKDSKGGGKGDKD